MSSKEELDNSIVDAVDTYRASKREELAQAVEDARVSWDYSNSDAYAAHWKDYHEAVAALKAYDKENT
jgi:hypothetical protein